MFSFDIDIISSNVYSNAKFCASVFHAIDADHKGFNELQFTFPGIIVLLMIFLTEVTKLESLFAILSACSIRIIYIIWCTILHSLGYKQSSIHSPTYEGEPIRVQ